MFWAKTDRVEAIAKKLTRDRLFSIRNQLKVVVDNDVPENIKKEDKLRKIRPIDERV